MRGTTWQTATAFHYKITISNKSWLHVTWSYRSLSLPLQLTRWPTPPNISARHLEGRYCFVDQNYQIPTQNGDPFEELSGWTEASFFLPFPISSAVVIICSDSWIFFLIICASLSLFLNSLGFIGSTTAFLEFLHSLSISPSPYPFCPIHKSKKAFSRLMLVLSLTLTLTTSRGIWHGAGATKGVTSPAAHRGI